ncbi:Uncharacterised protein [Bordetella pertussis]|nr:Uncharacterised protein [Bordetella pertussis]CFU01037.1 Uncharacterised protein [Bordetella pertussis]
MWHEPYRAGMPAWLRTGAVSSTMWARTSKPLLRRCCSQSSQQPQVGVRQTSMGIGVLARAAAGARSKAPSRARRSVDTCDMKACIAEVQGGQRAGQA